MKSKPTKREDKKGKYLRNKISYLLIGVYSGLCTLLDLGIKYYVKNYFVGDTSAFIKILSLFKIPFLIKPLYGFITDFLPIIGYKRKSYLIICSVLYLLIWIIFLLIMKTNFYLSIICLIIINIFLSFTTVIGQAISIDMTRSGINKKNNFKKNSSKLMSQYFICKDIGTLISSFFGGLLLEIFSLDLVFYLCTFLPFISFISGLILYEQKSINNNNNSLNTNKNISDASLKSNYAIHCFMKKTTTYNEELNLSLKKHISHDFYDEFYKKKKEFTKSKLNKKYLSKSYYYPNKNNDNQTNIFDLLKNKNIIYFLLIIFLIEASPGINNILFYYETNVLGITPKNYGIINLSSDICKILFTIIFNKINHKGNLKFKKSIYITRLSIFSLFFLRFLLFKGFIKIFFSNFIFLLIVISLHYGLERINQLIYSFMRIIFTPKNLAGITSSIIDFALNLGNLLSDHLGNVIAYLYNVDGIEFKNLGKLIFVADLCSIVPLIVLFFIPNEIFVDKNKRKGNNKKKKDYENDTSIQDSSRELDFIS